MQIYLPIAEMAVSAEMIFFLSALVGLISGVFGIGGGFLTTPFLIFIGIAPAVAVGTQASQLVASSMAGTLGHFRRGNVDLKMGAVMMVGGLLGSFVGSSRPKVDLPRLIELYQGGVLDLDSLITKRYPLNELAVAFEDMEAGKVVRGVLVFE